MADKLDMFDFLKAMEHYVPQGPSPEERRAFATQQYATYSPFHLNATYPVLVEAGVHVIPATVLMMDTDQLKAFTTWVEASLDGKEAMMQDARTQPAWQAMERRIQGILDQYPDGVFARLGSRSPKGALNPQHGEDFLQLPCRTLDQVMDAFTCSERTYKDLLDSTPIDAPMALILRPFQHHRTHRSEFRVFVKDGAIIGMCPMVPDAWDTGTDPSTYEPAIRQCMNPVLTCMDLPEYSVDIMLDADHVPAVLEINPPPSLGADPIAYRTRPFDGGFSTGR